MLKKIVILGAGGFGREASLLVEQINRASAMEKIELIGFIDDDQKKINQVFRSYKVLGGLSCLSKLAENVLTICVVGKPEIKKNMIIRAEDYSLQHTSLIDPDVELNGELRTGTGVLINKGCIFTTNITIGNHVSINPGCGIGHDVEIGDYTTLMWRVNLSGDVKVGHCCLLGTGVTVLQGLKIGNSVTIGAGAIVTKDLPDNCTAVGIPARII